MKDRQIVLILNDIRSALNVGAIFRTADGAGVEKIYLSDITATPDHAKVKKTALGAEEVVEWQSYRNLPRLLTKLEAADYQIVALELCDQATDFWETKFSRKVALIVGNELTGLNKRILDKSKLVIKIPMYGRKESLNVATATGIAVYEIVKFQKSLLQP